MIVNQKYWENGFRLPAGRGWGTGSLPPARDLPGQVRPKQNLSPHSPFIVVPRGRLRLAQPGGVNWGTSYVVIELYDPWLLCPDTWIQGLILPPLCRPQHSSELATPPAWGLCFLPWAWGTGVAPVCEKGAQAACLPVSVSRLPASSLSPNGNSLEASLLWHTSLGCVTSQEVQFPPL